MSKFPKRYLLPDGSIYIVTFENVKADWEQTVRQFDDLTTDQQDKQIADFDEDHAISWMSEQWYVNEVMVFGTDTGEVDEGQRRMGLESLKRLALNDWASEYETQEQPQ